jgi:hypothetical protein
MSKRSRQSRRRLESPRQEQAMLALLERHGRHPVTVEMDVIAGHVLIGALQLALRHPAFPRTSREIVQGFIRGFQARVASLDDDLAVLMELGNQPHRDVPHPPCRWCGEALTAHTAAEGAWLCAGGRRAYAPAEDG